MVYLIKYFYKFVRNAKAAIRIHNGKASIIIGTFNPTFYKECAEIIKNQNIRKGVIYTFEAEGNYILKFSKAISQNHQQRIRNLFYFY